MRQGVLKNSGSSIRWGWDGGIVSEARGLLKLRTSFSSASEPIFFRKERLTLLGAPVAPPVALYWLFDLILLSFIIKYIVQRSSSKLGWVSSTRSTL